MRAYLSIPVIASLAGFASLAGCDSSDQDRSVGQTDFESAPPNGGGDTRLSGEDSSGGGAPPPGAPVPPTADAPGAPRTVEETDLYRLEGTRLYYLNSYRGLMVFDVSNPDRPRMLGRSPIFGTPVDMIVRNGIAVVVIGDWFGKMEDGTPFHGSIVRGLDATDPANIRMIGEARLGGWVRDDRVVGDVIYAVSEDYGWYYGWAEDTRLDGVASSRPAVVVSSVSFANGVIREVDNIRYDGFTGVFNVTPEAIMLASTSGNRDQTQLQYIDISDPGGEILPRGSIIVEGAVNGWGADNGRWNLDFADGKTAHVVGQNYYNYDGSFTLSTADFSNPDAPQLASSLRISRTGWSTAARFDGNRLYLSPQTGWYDGSNTTPFQVYDLTNPSAPRLAGTITVPGQVWNILPAPGQRLFALGNQYNSTNYGSSVSLHYLDVTDPTAPQLLGTSKFGEGWAWTPAAGTFKAFTMDATKGLVVLPFSGWDYRSGYNNGLQLIEFSPSTLPTAGAGRTRGWVERGIFVGNRLMSLSDVSLAVIDYTDAMTPSVVTEVTLARNVITALPNGSTVAEISSDWWDNDTTSSQIRLLPVANAEETADTGAEVPTVNVDGVNARVFNNGSTAYVVTNVRTNTPCPGTTEPGCFQRAQQVQVVDLSSGATLRGKIQLPNDKWGYFGSGWYGFWWYDWWWGDEVVQVGGDVLAFRRWQPVYDASGKYLDTNSKLYIVDLANPDEPRIASTVIHDDVEAWWGNLRVVGNTLYTTHYEWIETPNRRGRVKYYLDQIDLSDRAKPRVGARINVPGLLVGGNASDPSIIYTIDYRWYSGEDQAINDFDVLRIEGTRARLLSHTRIEGWVGSTFVRGSQAYLSAQRYTRSGNTVRSRVDLHALDISNPNRVRDRVVSDNGWGWLLAVEGDRALVTSGWWGQQALDVYRLQDNRAPTFDQTIRTRGWWVNGVTRQDDSLFLSSGYWGVQKVDLQ
jgi:hypothetical protein